MQSISSRIWTRVAVSISCDDNHYTTGTYTVGFIICIEELLFPNLLLTTNSDYVGNNVLYPGTGLLT